VLADLLTTGACALYEELVASGGLPADDATGVLSDHDPALVELLSHGLVWESAGPPRRMRAVSLPVALRRLLGGRQRQLAEAHRQLADHYAYLERLEADVATTAVSRSSGVELVHGPDNVLVVLHDLVASARRECRMLQTDEPASRAAGWSTPTATASGTVRFRAICTRGVLQHAAARAEMEQSAGNGPAYRVLPELPQRMALVDEAALVPVDASRGAALLVRAPALVGPLSQYFELLWSIAAPFAERRSVQDDAPAPIQLQILRLAATGLKDEAIARSLGRSSRWVRRHFEALEERLGATNRLTLGLAAARRGWV